ncbi:MAG: FAD-dependent oxidoreductase [Pseudomonadota bacterium]
MAAPDVLVIGGGVFGLWCARACLGRGLSVLVADPAAGAGASGTPVGALAPMSPVGWSPLKALQLEGLLTLPAAVAALEAETGLSAGYARPGRLVALADAAARGRAEAQVAACGTWGEAGRMEILETPPDPRVLSPEVAEAGVQHDTLTGRIDTEAYLTALRAAVGTGAEIRATRCDRLVPGGAVLDGEAVAAGSVVLAAGAETLALAGFDAPPGEKGQAAVLAGTLPEGAPVLTGRGQYVVAHGPGRVGVGSTAEKRWETPGPDAQLNAVIARVRTACPALAEAPVVRRWAGVRPRAPRPGPMVGALPERPNVWVATGGHRIGFALAHLVGEAVAAGLAEAQDGPKLPFCTMPAQHLTPLCAEDAGKAGSGTENGPKRAR